MAWMMPVAMGLSGLSGLFGSKQKQQQAGQQSNVQNSSQYQSSQMAPNLNPLAEQGYGAISDKYMGLINQDPNLSGYQAQQSEGINRAGDEQERQLRESLAARGISGPAAETAVANARSQRFGQQVQLQQQIPLLARQMQEQTLGNAGQFYKGIPVGQANWGTSGQSGYGTTNQTGQITTGVNPLSGMFGGMGNILALLSGMGQGGGGSNSPNVGGGGFNP
jgi:hypothetical protein